MTIMCPLRPLRTVLTVCCATATIGCARAPHAEGADANEHTRAPWTDSARNDSALSLAARTATLEPGALGGVIAAPVLEFTAPGGRPFEVAVRSGEPSTGHTRRFGTITRPTSLRGLSTVLGQYPCTSCHFGRTVVMKDERIGDAHQNIEPVHPERVGAVCSTCHAADNVETLALKGGERPSLDQAYRLCAQCHFAQADAWAGGAHGKRLDGWQGRRVLMGCTDCHNPHRPALEPRTPFRAPRIERPRGTDR